MDFFIFMYVIQHCFICHPSNFIVSEDAGIEPRTAASASACIATDSQTLHSARSHLQNFEIVSGGGVLLIIFFTLLLSRHIARIIFLSCSFRDDGTFYR
jgi:hypothetical protein